MADEIDIDAGDQKAHRVAVQERVVHPGTFRFHDVCCVDAIIAAGGDRICRLRDRHRRVELEVLQPEPLPCLQPLVDVSLLYSGALQTVPELRGTVHHWTFELS